MTSSARISAHPCGLALYLYILADRVTTKTKMPFVFMYLHSPVGFFENQQFMFKVINGMSQCLPTHI